MRTGSATVVVVQPRATGQDCGPLVRGESDVRASADSEQHSKERKQALLHLHREQSSDGAVVNRRRAGGLGARIRADSVARREVRWRHPGGRRFAVGVGPVWRVLATALVIVIGVRIYRFGFRDKEPGISISLPYPPSFANTPLGKAAILPTRSAASPNEACRKRHTTSVNCSISFVMPQSSRPER